MSKWNTIEEFAQWYKENNYPIRPPFGEPIRITDISYSMVLYREGQYQVELYLLKPNSETPPHSHPGVESIGICWTGGLSIEQGGEFFDSAPYDFKAPDGTSTLFGAMGAILPSGASHSLFTKENGGAMLTLEKWPDGITPTSATVNWAGDPVDEGHRSLIQPLQD